MNSADESENRQGGVRIRSIAVGFTVLIVIMLAVMSITTIRLSVRFNNLNEKASVCTTDEITTWNLEDMIGYVKSQQREMEQLQKMFVRQQIYIGVVVVLVVVSFLIICFLVIRPIHMFESALDKDGELPSVGSAEMKCLADNINTSKRNNAASKLVFQHEAEHDALTGLFNRGAFEKMKQILSGSLEPIAVLLIDVDLFKHVNDNYGHEVGDAALKKVSAMLTEKFRSSDLVFRIGGDEFCVIMQKITPNEKHVIRDKLDIINADLQKADDKVPAKLSVSVGVAFSQFGFSEDLFKKSDKALYYTKEHGRKGYTFYNSKIESDGEE